MSVSGGDGPLDESVLLELFGDDAELHRDILGEFQKSCGEYSEEFDAAWRAQDAQAMKAVAHKLKSSSLTVGAVALAEICGRLEQAGKAQQWAEIKGVYPQLTPALTAVCSYISAR